MIRTVAALLLLGSTALASAQDLQPQIEAFIAADGFERQDVRLIETVLEDQFFNIGEIAPGGSVGPIEKALLLANAEIEATRTRTALAYGEIVSEQDGPTSFIELRHYNLGPTLRAEAIAEFGEDDVADAAAFGLGEHRAWRFVFQPLMGNAAALIDVSSKVISDKSAAKQRCGDRACLDPYAGPEGDVAWEELDGDLPSWPALYAENAGGIATPAFAAAQLAVLGFAANAESGRYQWTGGEHPEAARGTTPYRFLDIDRNLGQDDGIDMVWRETLLNDDALSAIAFRRIEVPGTVWFSRATTAR